MSLSSVVARYAVSAEVTERNVAKVWGRNEHLLGRSFRIALARMVRSRSVTQAANAFRRGDPTAARFLEGVVFDPIDFGRVFAKAAYESGAATMSSYDISKASFRLNDPRLRKELMALVESFGVQMSSTSREAIQEGIYRSIANDATPEEMADTLYRSIGLDSRYAVAVENMRKGLTDQGHTRAEAKRQANQYSVRLKNERATKVARTEMMRAVNEGQHAAYLEVMQRMGISDEVAELEWLVTSDDRLCPTCAPMSGERTNASSPSFVEGVSGPPLHPYCRCTTLLRFPDLA